MRYVTPKAIHIAGTKTDSVGLAEMLEEIGVPDWTTDTTPTSGSKLVEVAGKLCYKSFHEDLNANLQSVRGGDNRGYLANILRQKHYSVLEHVSDTYSFLNVSRVFTHELVRHRLASYSQESLRFVRLTDLGAFYPREFSLHEKSNEIRKHMTDTFETAEEVQHILADVLQLDDLTFAQKKKLTSAMRRMAPIGLATNIIMTANVRTWRHIIELRTSRHAEEEIRIVMDSVFNDQVVRHPNLYQDCKVKEVEGFSEVTFGDFRG